MSVASTKPETTTEEAPFTVSASPEELEAAGKARRDSVPRDSHGIWKVASHRRDPLDILHAADATRLPELVPIRYGRMLQSPFTFYRGSAAVMAADLAGTPTIGVTVQACGDCHLKNFGGFVTPERNIVFDINDFDETLPGPWEWDVKRLATSFVLATRSNGLSEEVARDSALTCARSYRKSVRRYAKMNCLDLWYERFGVEEFLAEVSDPDDRARIERRVEKAAAKRGADIDYPKLAQSVHGGIRIRDNPPLIFHPPEARGENFREQAQTLLKEYRESLPDDRRILFDRYRFVDAALKVVGIGSVGTRCWIALLMSSSNDPLFLQIKQAGASVLEPYAGKSRYAHNGRRVVIGQRLMQAASDIFLGWLSGLAGDFYVRQLRDAKISPLVETFDAPMFSSFARLCGANLARAHAKTGDAWTIGGYLGKSDQFEEAIGTFASAYADQAERDHAALKAAVKSGKIEIYQEE
ncbi:MAG: DUF2252 domain-containing protein [Vulcanimicrobiaceae bacterium]